jgi:hypothetical protein
MSEQEINHYIAININGWIHDEGIFYHDANGFTCYLADYCNSIPHAIDLAKTYKIALKPTDEGWAAYQDETNVFSDSLASKAICLCLSTSTNNL